MQYSGKYIYLFYISCFVLMQGILENNYILAQWIRTNGPYGGAFASIAADGNKIVTGLSFLSTDAGENWKAISAGNSLNTTHSLLVSGDTILGGIKYGGLDISSDNGNTWYQNTRGIKPNADVISLIRVGSNRIFAGTDSGLFKSADNGISWSQADTVFKNVSVTSIAVNENKIVLATRKGIYLSLDDGSSWKLVNSELRDQYSEGKVTINGRAIIFAIDFKGAYVSTDNGSTWRESNQGLAYKTFIYTLKSAGNNIFLSSGKPEPGLFKSTDSGSSWHFVDNGFPDQARVWDIAVSGSRIFTATEGAGIAVSSDSSTSWNQSNRGITGLSIMCLASKGDSLFAGTSSGGIHLSTDNGQNFKDLYKHYFNDIYVKAIAFEPGVIYAATSHEGVAVSIDNGNSWKTVGHASISSFALHKNIMYMTRDADPGHFGGLYYSTNNGNTWIKVTVLSDVQDASSVTSNGNTLFLIVLGKIYSSSDNGLTWKLSDNGTGGNIFNFIKANLSFVYAVNDSGKVYKSSNNGSDWILSNKGLPEGKVTSFAFYGDSVVFAGTDISGVYLSVDCGSSWKSVNSNLPDKNIRDLLIKGDNIFAAAGSTIWKRSLAEFFIPTLTERFINEKLSPLLFSLEQNYPNPFNPVTTIGYSIPKESFVELKLYDMLGRELSTLELKKQSPGFYKVLFDGTFLASGIYIYKIRAGEFSQSKKFIYLK